MKIVIASTFRDATPYLPRYLRQVLALRGRLEARGDHVTFRWGEGDSTDDTAERLRAVDPDAVVDVSTGHRPCPSHEVSDARWANVADFCNQLLDTVPACDVLLWVESDLIWEPATLIALVEQAELGGVVAAPVWMGDRFYDTWSVRLNGEPFVPPRDAGLIKVDSCSGALAIRGDLLEHRYPAEDACRGWTKAMGGVWLDTSLEVQHPC